CKPCSAESTGNIAPAAGAAGRKLFAMMAGRKPHARPRQARGLPVPGGALSAIVVENVSKHWTTAVGMVRAVEGLSFSLDAGTLNVLLGPSGCGKSTTLRLIAGLDQADNGRISIDGRDVTR